MQDPPLLIYLLLLFLNANKISKFKRVCSFKALAVIAVFSATLLCGRRKTTRLTHFTVRQSTRRGVTRIWSIRRVTSENVFFIVYVRGINKIIIIYILLANRGRPITSRVIFGTFLFLSVFLHAFFSIAGLGLTIKFNH